MLPSCDAWYVGHELHHSVSDFPRQTRNPGKYNKNAERNRLRAIESERRTIWNHALRQVEQLAATNDPSGALFNIGPVVRQDDGTVVSLETLRRREERKAEAERAKLEAEHFGATPSHPAAYSEHNQNVEVESLGKPMISKTQLKKLAFYAPRPPPPKPVIPSHITLPEGEENWLDLWDLSDDSLERRVQRAKKNAANERKQLRIRQKAGKDDRRAARDEKRRVYRDLKMTWKVIKGECFQD